MPVFDTIPQVFEVAGINSSRSTLKKPFAKMTLAESQAAELAAQEALARNACGNLYALNGYESGPDS